MSLKPTKDGDTHFFAFACSPLPRGDVAETFGLDVVFEVRYGLAVPCHGAMSLKHAHTRPTCPRTARLAVPCHGAMSLKPKYWSSEKSPHWTCSPLPRGDVAETRALLHGFTFRVTLQSPATGRCR